MSRSGKHPHSGRVTEIGDEAFYECRSLRSVSLPDTLTKIGWMTFRYCLNMKSLTVPESVTEIGRCAFLDCPQLTVICRENSYAHHYCTENQVSFIFG